MEITGLDELNTSIEEIEDTDGDSPIDIDLTSEPDDTPPVDGADAPDPEGTEPPKGTDTLPPIDGDGDGEGATASDDGTPTDIDAESLSGMEQYLAQFDIEGGMIDFKDGSRTHFTELDDAKQLDVLTKLHESATQDVETKYGLDEEEIGLVNYMRQQEGTIDEIIDRLAQQRANTYITAQEVKTANIDDMDADAVYTAHLLKSNSEATTEQLESDLAKAKEMSNFDNIVTSLKAGMLTEQSTTIANQQQANINEMNNEIESQRKEVVEVVSKMDSIDGLTINDGIKNDVLDLILNVNDDGDSQFMTEVFGEPEKLFKAAFWYKNGQDIISNREDYWKKEKSAAYKRGIADAQKGKISFSSSDVKKQNTTTPHYDEPDEIISLDDLNNF